MRTTLAVLCAIVACGAGLRAGKTSPDVPVNLWFDQTQALTSDGLLATANGVTADYINGLQNVLAVIQGSGNSRFATQNDTRQPATRSLCVDFGTQIANGSVPFGNGASRQCVNVLQSMLGYPIGAATVSIQSLHYGQSVQKLARWAWTDAGYSYRLGYGSDYNRNGVPDSPPVTVTSVEPQDAAAACTKWVMTPAVASAYATESSGNVLDPSATTGTAVFWRAALLPGGNEGAPELLGYYAMPFSATFTPR